MPWSKLLKVGLCRRLYRNTIGVMKGDTRSLDYSSYDMLACCY